MGLAKATEVYGGKDFALVYGGNEMAGYHTGYAFTLGQTVEQDTHTCATQVTSTTKALKS